MTKPDKEEKIGTAASLFDSTGHFSPFICHSHVAPLHKHLLFSTEPPTEHACWHNERLLLAFEHLQSDSSSLHVCETGIRFTLLSLTISTGLPNSIDVDSVAGSTGSRSGVVVVDVVVVEVVVVVVVVVDVVVVEVVVEVVVVDVVVFVDVELSVGQGA